MAENRLHVAMLSQPLRGMGGLCLGELLRLPEMTTVAASHDGAWRALVNLAEKVLADLPATELWQRSVGDVEITPMTVRLAVDAPRRQKAEGAWREPVGLVFRGVTWRRPEGTWLAYVPLVGAAAMADGEAELMEQLEREIRFAIQRAGEGSAEGADGLTLRHVVGLQSVEGLTVERTEVPLTIASPKMRAREEVGDGEEKSALREAAADLTKAEAAEAYEVEEVLEKVAEGLTGRGARSVLLVGPSGVGKTAAVMELVRTRARWGLGDRPFWGTSGSRLVMGALGHGAWQERCHKLCREAGRTRSVVYLGNIVELIEVGKSTLNEVGVAGQLRGYMARGELLAIAECTPEQLALLEREDPHLLAAFRQVAVDEPPAAKVRVILEKAAAELTAGDPRRRGKDFERIAVLAEGGLAEIERLHKRYATYSAFPGRPIRFLRNLMRDAEGVGYEAGRTVTAAEVTATFARETGLPMLLLDDGAALETRDAEEWFGARVVAQEEAVARVVEMLATVKAGLNRPRRPIASLLFIGPTGVGKTEMAKTLAEFFFSDRGRLVRFDMSEFATAAAVGRLVGELGSAEGLLTAKVREQPFSVVLLDEIEKAHPAFFDLMLQVLGEARLTDAAGRTADFSNCVVIMTSNLGSEKFDRGTFGLVEARKGDPVSHFVEEVRAFMRPELFNRVDRIVPFMPLDKASIRRVARRELDLVRRRDGLRLRDVRLEVEEEALDRLAVVGFDPAFGARPLKRAMEREMLAPLADALNGYVEGVPLNARVAVDGGRLKVVVRANEGERGTREGLMGSQLAERATRLRRKLQRLERSGAVLQIQNEVFTLQRQIERAMQMVVKLKKENSMMGRWRDRMKRVGPPVEELGALARDVEGMEEAALLAFYEQRELTPEARDWVGELGELEVRLRKMLLTLYAVRFPNPDSATVAVFGKAGRVMDLGRAYLAMGRRRGYEASLVWFQDDGEKFLRYREASAETFFGRGDEKLFGVALEFRGPFAAALFDGEAGWHSFVVGKDGTHCRVVMAQATAWEYLPPKESHLPVKPDGPARREYQLSERAAKDAYVDGKIEWGSLDEVIDRLAERRLNMLVQEPLGDEAEI